MQEQGTVLSVDGLKVSFEGAKGLVAVNNISFSIKKGKTLAIVGESGSGKSLTALALMGLLPNTAKMEGAVYLNRAKLVDDKDWRGIRGKDIGMIFQEPMSSLNPVMKIGKQLCEAIITYQNISTKQAKQKAIEWLGKVRLPAPEKTYERYPHQLSGGQKQRVMIAMAMCNKPWLLIADEPTTALDVTVQQEIVKLMKELQEENGAAMIFITHDLGLAGNIADDMLVMYKGEMIEYAATDEIINKPKHAYTKALLACRPSMQQKGKRLPIVSDFLGESWIFSSESMCESHGRTEIDVGRESGAFSDESMRESRERAETRAGHDLNNEPEYKNSEEHKTLLEVKDLKVWFTESRDLLGKAVECFKAVEDVSFTLKKGEVLGLVGESGCGKSTLGRSLMGLLPVHSGQILFNGEDLAHIEQKEWGRVRRQIQMVFQDPYSSLNPRMTIGDMLTEPMMVHGVVPKTELKKEAERLLDAVQLPKDSMRRYAHQFSGGQRQRIGIARALALRPELLICDESVSALDVSVQAQILNLLKDLQKEFQLSYLFISHDLSVVYYMSDRVMVMNAGKIVENGEAAQVLTQPQNGYTRKLVDAVIK